MKAIIYGLLALTMVSVSCGKKDSDATTETAEGTSGATEVTATATAKESIEAAPRGAMTGEASSPTAKFPTKGILAAYLKLQEALAKDDAKSAAQAGKSLYAEFNKADAGAIEAKKRADYLDLAADAKEHAEHISHNASDIAHQREHFATLSKDISELVEAFGSESKLYQAYCPMYNDNKGAVWISAGREIRNPYYGKEMLTCGSVNKEF